MAEEKEMTEEEIQEAVNAIYAYAAELKINGTTPVEIKKKLISECGMEEEAATDVLRNLDDYIASVSEPQDYEYDEGGSFLSGVLGWVIFIGFIIGINVLSEIFDWGYYIY